MDQGQLEKAHQRIVFARRRLWRKRQGPLELARVLGGNQTTTVTCPGNAPVTQNSLVSVTLSNGSGADLQYTSNDGCLFKFNVSGSTATLANGPVTCSATSNGTAVSLSVASYTLYTSDGHHLTANAVGTATVGGVSCVFGLTGSGTR